MTVSKLTNNVKPLDEVDKINEIIDELGNLDPLPSQTGQSGKYLTTNGTIPSWADVQSLPSQTGNANKFLTTDGTNASWSAVPTRNIGEIISSTVPLTDAGLHLLDGALIQGRGIYNAFVDYIASIVSTYPSVFTTESAWQTSVSTYGVCGKFVYDATANTVRLPKVTGIVEGTTDVNALGDLVQAGLPQHTHTRGSMNITGEIGTKTYTTSSGAFQSVGTNAYTGNVSNNGFASTSFDASRSWTGSTSNANYTSTVNTSSTVQPQTIKVLYYIVVATSTKTDIQIDIDEVVTDLNGKADRDLLNVSDTGNIQMAKASMPSGRRINLTLGASGSTFIIPADGWIRIRATSIQNGGYYRFIGDAGRAAASQVASGSNQYLYDTIPVSKDNSFYVEYSYINLEDFFFIYAKGSESEAS